MCLNVCVHMNMYICMYVCGYVDRYGYVCLSMYVYMHMSTHIITLMDVLIIYLKNTFVHGFMSQTYTPLSNF